LTKESAGVVALSAAAAAAGNLNPVMESESEVVPPSEPVSNAPQARTRKTSWIANPSAVDKLLTLFNTGTIFHRSSSPEPKASQISSVPATNSITNSAQS